MIDVEKTRADTPGCASVAHLNNAGSALPPQRVLDAVVDHLLLESIMGGYEAARAAEDAIEHTYDAVAELIGANRDEIALMENASRAWDMAFYAIDWRDGDRILTATAEYASNAIAYLQVARRHGVRVEVVPDDQYGQLDVAALRSMADDRVKLIGVTHVPTNGGLVNPAAEIGAVAKEIGALYLLDACQSVGQMPVNVAEIGADMLSATGRKYLRGPRGTGFLYVSNQVLHRLEPPFLDLRSATWTGPNQYSVRTDSRRFETWEYDVAGRIGLGVAVDYALELGLAAIGDRVTGLAETLRERLAAVPGVRVHDQGARRCGLVTFSVDGMDAADVSQALFAHRINTSVSPAGWSHWSLVPRGLPDLVRASVHYYNTEEELDRLCAVLTALRTGGGA